MGTKIDSVSTQIRLPQAIHDYLKQESSRLGIAQNALLVILLEQGKKLWEAKVNITQEVQ